LASSPPIIVWFRRDLRVTDNPALYEASQRGRPVLPVYILEEDAPRPLGGAAKWWLHHSLSALKRELVCLGAPLLLRRGRAADVLAHLASESGATDILWNQRYDPREMALDQTVTKVLVGLGRRVESFKGALLFEPAETTTQNGQPFQIFTAFWRQCLSKPEPSRPLPRPAKLQEYFGLSGDDLAEWRLLPKKPDWAAGFATSWTPGEDSADARLTDFVEDRLADYLSLRNRPDLDGTSRLSAHLAFGELSPRQVWHAARMNGAFPEDGFLRQLGWREFSHHMLHQFPAMATTPRRARFQDFPWQDDEELWRHFTLGQTGYPIVDAAMRALWETGWMHNRLRMVVGSFLVKDLLIPWQRGEQWFWDTLVDADPACNACGWQWISGCGIESAPYFRIFNPLIQGERFDPDGQYLRRWLPELSGLPDRFIHRPWEAPPTILKKAGVQLGRTYPPPIVEHAKARDRALEAFARLRLVH